MKYRKINYEKSKYINLPDKIKNLIDKEDYARCYKNDNYYIVQLRLVNKTNYSNLEFEFDVKKNRFLTREEREQKVPKDRELFFAEYGVEIFIQYYLEEKTDILKESYQIYSLDTNEKLEDYEQDFFSMNRTFKDKAKEVYESAKKKNLIMNGLILKKHYIGQVKYINGKETLAGHRVLEELICLQLIF